MLRPIVRTILKIRAILRHETPRVEIFLMTPIMKGQNGMRLLRGAKTQSSSVIPIQSTVSDIDRRKVSSASTRALRSAGGS